MCVCLSVFVCERESKRERYKENDDKRDGERKKNIGLEEYFEHIFTMSDKQFCYFNNLVFTFKYVCFQATKRI